MTAYFALVVIQPVGLFSIEEKEVLRRLYDSTHASQWSSRQGWLQRMDDARCPDHWAFVVQCLPKKPGGTKLRFEPAAGLGGTLPTQLGRLSSLQWLTIAGSPSLSGTLPTELGQLTHLERLHIVGSRLLSGTLPTELGAPLSRLDDLIIGPCYKAALLPAVVEDTTALTATGWLQRPSNPP